MILKIIDCVETDGAGTRVQIVFENDDGGTSFVTEPYVSPFTDSFRQSLSWYFSDYLFNAESGDDDCNVVEKLLKFGKYLGDGLLGEDDQLITIKERIEEIGYANLRVQIESGRPEFFEESWETAILHESKYILSAVANGYVRRTVGERLEKDYPSLSYGLKRTQPADAAIKGAFQNTRVESPLRVLYILSRPEQHGMTAISSNAMNLDLASAASGGAIDYEIFQPGNRKQLLDRLSDKSRPVHILHYDGPLLIDQTAITLPLGFSPDEHSDINLAKLCQTLVRHNVGLLSIDARGYAESQRFIAASRGLAMAARLAHQQGLGNVIGLAQITDPWSSSQCLESVYNQLTKGLSLAQAVVEARKSLQADTASPLMTAKPVPFHRWALLQHYGMQEVTFFQPAQPQNPLQTQHHPEPGPSRMFGFQSELLPPLLQSACDGLAPRLISHFDTTRQTEGGHIVSVVSEPGCGKSHLAHVVSLYLAHKQQINFAFYFDFAMDVYTPADMLAMIAPLMQLETQQLSTVEEKLSELHCCFVLDNISCLADDRDEAGSSHAALDELFTTLSSHGHKIILIGESDHPLLRQSAITLKPGPLSPAAQKVLAAQQLRQSDLAEVKQDRQWHELLNSLNGHPWLIKKTLPLLKTIQPDELHAQIEHHINDLKGGSKIDRFHQWQWSTLEPVWQHMLILCSEERGLLLETLMIAFDQGKGFEPAVSLVSLMDSENVQFSDGLEKWETAGFVNRLPHGRVIDPGCLSFLSKKREHFDVAKLDQKKMALHFSQVLCKGIQMLARHIIQHPDPSITRNLLINRQRWALHFERLWFNRDYRRFIEVKRAFDQLLQQAGLIEESHAWSLDLLERSSTPAACDGADGDTKLAWLSLASDSLKHAQGRDNPSILEGCKIWQTWFDSLTDPVDQEDLSLFQQAAAFLENFYRSHSQWHDCIAICQKTYSVYAHYQVWQRAIHSLKSLAHYHAALGEKQQAYRFEQQVINDIPYDQAPAGTKTKQMIDILLSRLNRSDTQAAQDLLNQLRSSGQAQTLNEMLDSVQGDIYFQNKNFSAALPYYCKIWVKAMRSNQPTQLAQLQSRMSTLKQQLGTDRFNQCFEQEAPLGTPKPEDYVNPLH